MIPVQYPTRLEQFKTATKASDMLRSDQPSSDGIPIAPAHATRGAQHYRFQVRSATQNRQEGAESELTSQIVQTVDCHFDSDVEEILTASDTEEGPLYLFVRLVTRP